MDFAIYMYLASAYMGITLVLSLVAIAEMPWWLLHPRALILVPITGLLIGAPLMLLFLTPFQIAYYLGWLPDHSILPGALVLWTATSIWMVIDRYLEERGKRLRLPVRWIGSVASRTFAALQPAWQRSRERRHTTGLDGLSGWRGRRNHANLSLIYGAGSGDTANPAASLTQSDRESGASD